MKHGPQDEAIRKRLLRILVQSDGVSPLGIELSAVSLAGVREDWFIAAYGGRGDEEGRK